MSVSSEAGGGGRVGRPEFVLKCGKQEAEQEGDPGLSHERASPYNVLHRSPVDCSLNPSLHLDPRIPFFVLFFWALSRVPSHPC